MATRRDIEALRRAAIRDDDLVTRILCDVALTRGDSYAAPAARDDALDAEGYPDYSGGGWDPEDLEAARQAQRMTEDDAWAACERIIEDNARAEEE